MAYYLEICQNYAARLFCFSICMLCWDYWLDCGASADSKDVSSETALHKAAGSGHVEVAKLLLEKKAFLHKLQPYTAQHNRSEGEAERDIGSPCMIGLGLVVVEKFFRRRRRRRRHLGVDPKKTRFLY